MFRFVCSNQISLGKNFSLETQAEIQNDTIFSGLDRHIHQHKVSRAVLRLNKGNFDLYGQIRSSQLLWVNVPL
jgi:hypothetical protein